MNETAKNEMRNYLSAAGFCIFALSSLIVAARFLSGETGGFFQAAQAADIILSVLLLLIGVLLAVLGKRDLTAISFLMFGSLRILVRILFTTNQISVTLAELFSICIILQSFFIILALILLTAKDKAKYPLALLIGLEGIFNVVNNIIQVSISGITVGYGYSRIILAVLALYFAFACASERIILPLGKTLTAEQETDFKKSASALGYLTISASMAVWAFFYLFKASDGVAQLIYSADGVYAILMILIGVLLFAVAKMRFTPVMFLLAGALLAVSSVIGDSFEFIIGILFIVLGLFAVLRTESRILPGLMFVIYGISYFIVPVAAGAGITILAVLVNGLPALIALYLAVATFSQKKLPLF